MALRIDEAIARAKRMGLNLRKKDIAARLWADATEPAQQMNMTNLCTGRTKRIQPEWVNIICEMCNCTPDYLFGYFD